MADRTGPEALRSPPHPSPLGNGRRAPPWIAEGEGTSPLPGELRLARERGDPAEAVDSVRAREGEDVMGTEERREKAPDAEGRRPARGEIQHPGKWRPHSHVGRSGVGTWGE